jgi:ElaB/YqjD/DUF883 family membrane-anchored ribosome-binding protein
MADDRSEVAEAWRRSTTKLSADLERTARDAREAAAELSDALRRSAAGVADTAAEHVRDGAATVRQEVKQRPLVWLAAAAGAGAVIGMLLANSRGR